MFKICFYITGYGYGHASRDIAIIRCLKNRISGAKIFVRSDRRILNFVKQSISFADVSSTDDYFGVINSSGLGVDKQRTFELIQNGLNNVDFFVEKEKKFCSNNEIDLIFSDIPPQPFLVAAELGVTSIAVTNFSWYFIYKQLFGSTPEINRIKNMYEKASVALKLPLNEPMDVFRRTITVPLVYREAIRKREDIRRKIGVNSGDCLVYVSSGFSSFVSSKLKHEKGIKYLLSSYQHPSVPNTCLIPVRDVETQDYMAACDLVVSKASYGTVSEAIAGRVPMLLCNRSGFQESEYILNAVEKLGIGNRISEKEFLDGSWIKSFKRGLSKEKNYNNLPKEYAHNGVNAITEFIEELLL